MQMHAGPIDAAPAWTLDQIAGLVFGVSVTVMDFWVATPAACVSCGRVSKWHAQTLLHVATFGNALYQGHPEHVCMRWLLITLHGMLERQQGPVIMCWFLWQLVQMPDCA